MKIEFLQVGSIGSNCFIVCDEENGYSAIIDPGADAPRIASVFEKYKCPPKMILLTHGHFDHIGAVHALQDQYHCQLAVSKDELSFLNNSKLNLQDELSTEPFVPFHPDVLFSDGDTVEVGSMQFKVIETPGHTPGSACFLFGQLLFSGDTLFAGSMGRTDFPGGNAVAMAASLKKLALLPGNLKVLPGHGVFSTLGAEKETNPYLTHGLTE